MRAGDTTPEAIIDLFRSMRHFEQQAAQQYKPVVDDILRSRSQDIRHIEHTLDRLFDFCGFEPVRAMYKQLCRHYWDIDPAATAHYVNAYREYWIAMNRKSSHDRSRRLQAYLQRRELAYQDRAARDRQ